MSRKISVSFRPAVEELEVRWCPSTTWQPVGGSTDWTIPGNWSNGTPVNGSDVVFDGNVSNASCINVSLAGGSLHSLVLQNGYSGTLTMNGDLTTGAPPTNKIPAGNNNLSAGTINLNGNFLTLQGPNDVWNACGMTDTKPGAGVLVIAATGSCTCSCGFNVTMYDLLAVNGSLTFNNSGALDFGAKGSLNDFGTVTVAPTNPAGVTFAGNGNTTAWNVTAGGLGVGTLIVDDNGFTVSVPVGVNVTGGGSVQVKAGTGLSFNGDAVFGSPGNGSGSLNLYAGAQKPTNGFGGSTTFFQASTLTAYNNSVVGQTHNSPAGNASWSFAYLRTTVLMRGSSQIVADYDQTGQPATSVPILTVTGGLNFYDTATIVTSLYVDGNHNKVGAGASEVAVSGTTTFSWPAGSPATLVVQGGAGANPNQSFGPFLAATGGYTGTGFLNPAGWVSITESSNNFFLNS